MFQKKHNLRRATLTSRERNPCVRRVKRKSCTISFLVLATHQEINSRRAIIRYPSSQSETQTRRVDNNCKKTKNKNNSGEMAEGVSDVVMRSVSSSLSVFWEQWPVKGQCFVSQTGKMSPSSARSTTNALVAHKVALLLPLLLVFFRLC